jgi:hypothetical protein
MTGRNASRIANLAGGSVELLPSPANQRNPGSMFRESLRDGEIDSASTTGNDGGLSIEHFLFEYFRHRRFPPSASRGERQTYSSGESADSTEPDAKNPVSFRIRGWLLVAHPSYKHSQQH